MNDNTVKKEQFTKILVQDVEIKGYFWQNTNISPKGIILICHGMAEHINRYNEFAYFLASNGYVVCGYDQRGHGQSVKSENDFGYMSDDDNFKTLVNDLFEIQKLIREKYPNLPLYLFGHSMGSFISQRYIELYGNTINGLILSGSSLNKGFIVNAGYVLSKIITKFKGRRYRSKFIDNLSLGTYNKPFKPNRTNVDWLSLNEKNVDNYIDDEYCGKMFTVSYFMDLLKGFKDITKNYELVPHNLPIYIFSGEDDPVGNMGKNVQKLYQTYLKKHVADVEMKLYPHCRHEMLNENNYKEVYSNILQWLEKH